MLDAHCQVQNDADDRISFHLYEALGFRWDAEEEELLLEAGRLQLYTRELFQPPRTDHQPQHGQRNRLLRSSGLRLRLVGLTPLSALAALATALASPVAPSSAFATFAPCTSVSPRGPVRNACRRSVGKGGFGGRYQ